ncbi:MAG: TetR family transcriptional regulator [Mycobacterium sp.]
MTESTERRADTTREQILRAASHQFARRPYYDVGLDDILAEAELTKGAMYFHFRSKHALALAIIEAQATESTATVQDLLTRKLSGLETLVDVAYMVAVRDLTEDVARAGLHLLESVGRTEGVQARLLGDWTRLLALIVERAIAEGDIIKEGDPEAVGHLLVSLYMGLRQASDLDDPEQFLLDMQRDWTVLLRGVVEPDRFAYFTQFIKRRTALAIKTATQRDSH